LQERLERLREPLTVGDPQRLKGESQTGGLEESRRLRALLESPALRADERAAVWAAWLPLAWRLHQQTLERELRPPAVPDFPPPLDPSRALAEAAECGLQRARWSRDLLRLFGAPAEQLKAVDAALKVVEEEKQRAYAVIIWQRLAQALRHAWAAAPDGPPT
jgi:hypothetical protein